MEATDYLRAAVALVFTLSLMGVIAWLVGRYGRSIPGLLPDGKSQRLTVLERRMIDARHQLVLLRRDNTEHLVLLAGNAAPVVIEQNIAPTAGAKTP